MNIKSLLVGTIVGQIFFVITKVIFINYLNFDNTIIFWLFFVLLTVETIAIVRRMGILNLFESIFLAAIWLIVSLLTDLVVTANLIGYDIYKHIYFWATYLVIILALFIFHKKAHIEARKSKK